MKSLKQMFIEKLYHKDFWDKPFVDDVWNEDLKPVIKEWLKQKLEESDKQYSETPNLLIKYENSMLQKLLRDLQTVEVKQTT